MHQVLNLHTFLTVKNVLMHDINTVIYRSDGVFEPFQLCSNSNTTL